MENNCLKNEMLEHPAAIAWDKFCSGQNPDSIEVLTRNKKLNKKRGVYRLVGVGIGGSDVVAKRLQNEAALVEHQIYEKILPHFPVKSLHYYGKLEETDCEYSWLFLEYANGERYSHRLRQHIILAAHWLGTIHTHASDIKGVTQLPDRGPDFYLELLRLARKNIQENLSNSSLVSSDLNLLGRMLSSLDIVESIWEQIERICLEIPRTLIHGDFVEKNLHVETTKYGLNLLCFDWEMGGYGVPATDLTRWSNSPPALPNLSTYLNEVKNCWNFDIHTINILTKVGTLFRYIATIYWKSLGLSYIRKPFTSIYRSQLRTRAEVYRANLLRLTETLNQTKIQ